ncbi:MAG: ROK family transcriptional regulator [Spirochaetales bacterium]|jgi:predicted NBD/HSP70 family sugar kinase|nr:ROK family transcriptional regulator [Spirochaetales bacterium]
MKFARLEETGTDLAIHTLIELIWKNGPLSRAELSRLSGFSRSTITLNVDKLLQKKVICEEPRILHGELGKRTSLSIAKDQGLIIGIEMGANSCEIGVCSILGELGESTSFCINYAIGPNVILEQLTQAIDSLVENNKQAKKQILGIGIGLPSPVDFSEGYAVHPAFMPGWHLFPIGKILQEHYRCPVFVDNEVNTMGLGESYLSNEYRDKNILFVKAGTAIGAGIIIHGNIYRGNSGLGGNIGHIQIEGHTQQCKCGKLGCLEAAAGGEALGNQAVSAAENGKSPVLMEIYNKKGFINAADIQQAAAKGDTESLRIIKHAGLTLGKVLGNLVIFFDPKAVVIGGGLTGFGPQYIAYIRESIMHQGTPWIRSDFTVRESHYGSRIGIIGSAMLCIKQLIDFGYLA